MFLFDSNYISLVCLPSLVISLFAHIFIWLAFSKWRRASNGLNLNVADVIERSGLSDSPDNPRELKLPLPCQITEHNLFSQILCVEFIHHSMHPKGVIPMAVIAHQLGHKQQQREHPVLIQMLYFLVPAVQISSIVCYLFVIIGLLLTSANLFWLGLLLLSIVMIFTLLTLPIEVDASLRGLRLLREKGLMVTTQDLNGVYHILTAVALSPVAVFITGLLQLNYYFFLLRERLLWLTKGRD
jgi:uncharacterized protein